MGTRQSYKKAREVAYLPALFDACQPCGSMCLLCGNCYLCGKVN